MQQYLSRKKIFRIVSVLSFLIISTHILAQKRRTIELKINKQHEYNYETNDLLIIEDYIPQTYKTQAISNLKIEKNKEGNFTIKEKIKALNIISSGQTIFSFGILFEQYSRQSVFQHYIKNKEFESEIDSDGKVTRPWDLSLLKNDIILDEYRKEELLKILTKLSVSSSVPYLNRPLMKGDTFKVAQVPPFLFKMDPNEPSDGYIELNDSLPIEINYKVIEMDNKQTLLYFYYEVGLPVQKADQEAQEPQNASIKGMVQIDNETGMPKSMRQLVISGKYSYAVTLNRLGEKILDAGYWEYLKSPLAPFIRKDTVLYRFDDIYIKDQKALEDSIDKADISFRFKKHGYFNHKKKLKVKAEDVDCVLLIELESIKCYHSNKQVSDLINYQDEYKRTLTYFGGINTEVPFSNMGEYAEIDSVVISCKLKGYTGSYKKEIKHSDVGKLINLKGHPFQVLKWEKNKIKVKGSGAFHFYGKDGKILETYIVSEENSPGFVEPISKLLSVPGDQITAVQRFLFEGINGSGDWETTYEYFCPQSIEKVVYSLHDKTVELKKRYVVKGIISP